MGRGAEPIPCARLRRRAHRCGTDGADRSCSGTGLPGRYTGIARGRAAPRHAGGAGPAAPYAATRTAANRAQAVAALEDISRAVFAKDLEDNFEHRGWLQRWLERIPEYIDWQIARQASWRVSEVE